MPTLRLSSLHEFVHAGAAGIQMESLRASVPDDSECEATDYYDESDFGGMDASQERASISEQLDSDSTVPYDDASSFELPRSFCGQQSCDLYPEKNASPYIEVKRDNIARVFSRDNNESPSKKSKSNIRKYLLHKRKQATTPIKVL